MPDINRKQFENLCKLQCSLEEMASWFECNEADILSWCKNEYGEDFEAVFDKKSKAGLISLRRAQFKLAEKSAPMAMFLGKQYLGQDNKVAVELSTEERDDGDDAFFAAVIANATRPAD